MATKAIDKALSLFPTPPSSTKKPVRNFSTKFNAPKSAVEATPTESKGKEPQEVEDGRQSALSGKNAMRTARAHSAFATLDAAVDSAYYGGSEPASPELSRTESKAPIDGKGSAESQARMPTAEPSNSFISSERLALETARAQSAIDHYQSPRIHDAGSGRHSSASQAYIPAAESGNPIRTHTSMSNAPTLVRSMSNASHNAATRPRMANTTERSSYRSIFPQYNPDLPLIRQSYFPARQDSIPGQRYGVNSLAHQGKPGDRIHSLRSPMSAPPTVTSFGGHITGIHHDTPPKVATISTTNELKELWKVVNGWRVSPSEARTYSLKLDSSAEAPVHILSSTTQPFYTLKLDPTSTSAQVSLYRQDPYKPNSTPKLSSGRSRSMSPSTTGISVLHTTLEEKCRRLPPNDGLIALLYPIAASSMALELSTRPNIDTEQVFAQAEAECARLTWNEDHQRYYLLHPAMATPFSIQIESYPAWSRVEYTLEHPELSDDLVKLTRDGRGGGIMEISTAVAAQINSFYIVDVAVCAVLLVAIEEEKKVHVEMFDAPPTVTTAAKDRARKTKSMISVAQVKDVFIKKAVKVEEMEIDLESQDSLKGKKENLPKSARGVIGILFMLLRLMVWVLTLVVNVLAKVIIGFSTCMTRA